MEHQQELGLANNPGGSIEGAGPQHKKKHPFWQHLDDLQEAVYQWLDASCYRDAHPNTKRALNQKGLIPTQMDAEMPEVYFIFKLCKEGTRPWWPGGVANQPYILMMEFNACAQATVQFRSTLRNKERILRVPSNKPAKRF